MTVLALAGGAAVATSLLSGGGSQPAAVLPADAFAYLRLDIDPAAGQKVAAVRFLGAVPEVKDALTGDDPRRALWKAIVADTDDACVTTLSYDADIAPWLGERAGIAVRPGGTATEPNVALALQVTDEDRARTTLTRLLSCSGSGHPDLRMRDGYAIVTTRGQGDATLAAVDAGALADDPTFSGDMTALGEQGVASMWVDAGPALSEGRGLDLTGLLGESLASSPLTSPSPAGVQGRVAAALRFDPSYVELAGITRGFTAAAPGPGDGTQLARLPADTMAALHVSGADAVVDSAWPELERQIQDLAAGTGVDDPIAALEEELDLSFPDDLVALLGHSLTLSLPGQDIGADQPVVGVTIVSSDAARADTVISRVEDTAGATGLLTHRLDGDHLYVATSPDYAADLLAGGHLGDGDAFRAAMGDVSRSSFGLYLDLDRLEPLYLDDTQGGARTALRAMRALGVNVGVTGAGEAAFSVRLVAD
ncbi:MAG: DUF3352 domain-containing protein [Terracoccus sp.]